MKRVEKTSLRCNVGRRGRRAYGLTFSLTFIERTRSYGKNKGVVFESVLKPGFS